MPLMSFYVPRQSESGISRTLYRNGEVGSLEARGSMFARRLDCRSRALPRISGVKTPNPIYSLVRYIHDDPIWLRHTSTRLYLEYLDL